MSSYSVLSTFLGIVTDQLSIRGFSIGYYMTYRKVSNIILALVKTHDIRISYKLPNLVDSDNQQQLTWWGNWYLYLQAKYKLYTCWELYMVCNHRFLCAKSYSFIYSEYCLPKTTFTRLLLNVYPVIKIHYIKPTKTLIK